MSYEIEPKRDVAIAVAGETTIDTIQIPDGGEVLSFEVHNSDDAIVLDAFKIQRQLHSDGGFETIADAAGNYLTPLEAPLMEVSDSTPVTLAANASVHVRMDVRGTAAIKLLASAAVSATTVSLFGKISIRR